MSHPNDNLLRAWASPDAVHLRDSASEGSTMAGHFAVFNTWTEIDSAYEGRFMERIAPGAFADTFAKRGDSIRVLYDHGSDPSIGNKPLGQIVSLSEDRTGAAYEVALFDTTYVSDLKPALAAGQLGASFRFSITGDDWRVPTRATQSNPDRLEERTITSVDLWEFGPVTFPAYADATAGLRSGTDHFLEMLHDPLFLARFADRVGPAVLERLITTVPADGGSVTPVDVPGDAGSEATPTILTGRLVATAQSELRKIK